MVVAGGGRTVARAGRVALDVSASVDPNACAAFAFGALAPPPAACPAAPASPAAAAAGLSFFWACASGPAGVATSALSPCRLANGSLLALPAAAAVAVDVGALNLAADLPADIVLSVSAAASGAPPGVATTTLRVVDADAVAAARLDTLYANAEGAAFLATAAGAAGAAGAAYRWSIAPAAAAAAGEASPLDASDGDTFPAGTAGRAFLVRLDSPWARAGLARGVTYRVTVTVTPVAGASGGAAPATLWADFTPGPGPARGTCRMVTVDGGEGRGGAAAEYAEALVAECAGWVAEDLPLRYSFAVVDPLTAAAADAAGAAAAGALDDAAAWGPWGFSSRCPAAAVAAAVVALDYAA